MNIKEAEKFADRVIQNRKKKKETRQTSYARHLNKHVGKELKD
jgi:hypothetical protein